MTAKEKTPIIVASQRESKGKQLNLQYQIVYQSFKERPKTMLQVSLETGILRANICRYVAKMRKHNNIRVIRYGYCPCTHYRAGFLSTDQVLFTKEKVKQLKLFGNGQP